MKAKKNVSKNSKLISLYPFLDEHDVIRVGGRLEKSSLPYDQMHPMVLPKENAITDLIAKHIHIKSFHAGPQLLLSNIRQKYWPIGGRNLASRVFHQCVKCFRAGPKLQTQLMGKPSTIYSDNGTNFVDT